MTTIDFSLFISAAVYAGMAVIALLWIYYDRHGQSIHAAKRNRDIFHCVKCGHVYTAPRGMEEAHCPRCGMDNIKLRF